MPSDPDSDHKRTSTSLLARPLLGRRNQGAFAQHLGHSPVIDVTVPMLRRGHLVEQLCANIAETTRNPYRIIFVCSPNDEETVEACRATEHDVIVVNWKPGKADWAKKMNLAYERTEGEWIFQAASDLLFHANWDSHALATHASTNARVIGTNDLGNPLVKRGRHSTHTLFARDYIEEYGSGTLDNSGRVFTELYDHQWADNELIETARVRGELAFARHSIVEHLHPHWGKAPVDETYEKAGRGYDRDRVLFQKRFRELIRPAAR